MFNGFLRDSIEVFRKCLIIKLGAQQLSVWVVDIKAFFSWTIRPFIRTMLTFQGFAHVPLRFLVMMLHAHINTKED